MIDLAPRRMGRPPSCTCGTCTKCKKAAYMREYYRSKSPDERRRIFVAGRDPERVAAHDKEITQARRDSIRRSRLRHPDRNRARSKVYWAVKSGRLVRLPCYSCGAPKVEAHHPDYNRPLDVVWACRRHHVELHTAAPSWQVA